MRKPRQKKDLLTKEVTDTIEEAKAATAHDSLAFYESLVANDFAEIGLPTEQGNYVITDDQGNASGPMGLVELVKALGYEDHSREYYGAWVLTYIAAIRQLQAAEQTDAVIEVVMDLGALLAEEEFYEFWSHGRRSWESQKKAALATWGSPQQRLAKKERLISLYKEAIKNGAKTDQEAYRAAARMAHTSARTVRRAVTDH